MNDPNASGGTSNGIDGDVSGAAVQARDMGPVIILQGNAHIGTQNIGDVHNYNYGVPADGEARPTPRPSS